MVRRFRYLLIISCLVFVFRANAQFDDPKTLEVGPHVGVSYYMGDLNPKIPFAQSRLQYGGVVRYNYNNRWTFRFDYTHATVKGDDAVIKWRPERGLNFTTKINDFSLVAEFNFLEYYTGNPKRNVSPYIFGGFSVFQYTPFAEVAGQMVKLRDYTTEEVPSDVKWYEMLSTRSMPVALSIPFGFGVKLSLSRHMAATVEWRMQKTFTDYLDDVATVYASNDFVESNAIIKENHIVKLDNGEINTEESYVLWYSLSDPSAGPMKLQVDTNGNEIKQYDEHNSLIVPGNFKAGQQRGNASFNDWFGMARVSLTWKFNLPDRRGCNLSKF